MVWTVWTVKWLKALHTYCALPLYVQVYSATHEVVTISQRDVWNKCDLAATGAWHIWEGADNTLAQQKQQGGCESVFTAHKASEVTALAWLMGQGSRNKKIYWLVKTSSWHR